MFKDYVSRLTIICLLLAPQLASAAGLVPCGGPGEEACQFCHFATITNNVVGWLVAITGILAAIIFVVAGMRLVTSAGNVSAKEWAKEKITNAAIGFVIILAAWLLIDFVMKSLLSAEGTSKVGPWNKLSCVTQPLAVGYKINHPTPNASRGVAYSGSAGPVSPALLAALAALPAPDDKVAAAAAANGLTAEQTKNLQALMRVESGGCRNKTSPVGAQGCMQIMPDTARQYSSDLAGLSDAAVIARLRDDDDFNIALGTQIYADLYQGYNGNEQLVFAAYNGGPGANGPSLDCPGLKRWQCVWDSPGCYDTGQTNCVPNTGYKETREYVEKVAGVALRLP